MECPSPLCFEKILKKSIAIQIKQATYQDRGTNRRCRKDTSHRTSFFLVSLSSWSSLQPPFHPMSIVSANPAEQVTHCVRQCRSYPRQSEPRIVHDLVQCCRHFPMLAPVLGNFSFKQLSNVRLVALQGLYVSPNALLPPLPLRIWIMPYFPKGPPLVFVLNNFATEEIAFPIRPNHPHLDYHTGLVYIPYLSQWHARSSTVLSAVDETIRALTSVHRHYYEPQLPLTPSSSYSTDLVCHTGSPPSSNGSFDETSHVSKAELIASLSKRLSVSMHNLHRVSNQTIASLQSKKDSLLDALTETKRQRQQYQTRQDMSVLLDKHQSLLGTKHQLEQLNSRYEQSHESLCVDEATQAPQTIQNQTMSCLASDQACDDVLEQMDEALCKGVVSLTDYLTAVRGVAREQFFARALVLRLRQEPSCAQFFTMPWPP